MARLIRQSHLSSTMMCPQEMPIIILYLQNSWGRKTSINNNSWKMTILTNTLKCKKDPAINCTRNLTTKRTIKRMPARTRYECSSLEMVSIINFTLFNLTFYLFVFAEGVGKTSIIVTLISDDFSKVVPKTYHPVTISPD